MKIRSLLELQDTLDKDIIWRKKEFTTLKFMIMDARKHEEKILIRSAITLLYSHWEGHIKHCAISYLIYLKYKAPSYKQMTHNFIQLSLGEVFRSGFSVTRFSSQKDIFEYITKEHDGKFDIDEKMIIDTDSNLKYDVLLNILGQLGLNQKAYELKENFINSKLLKCRNAIVHGEQIDLKELNNTYIELEKELLSMIELFRNLVQNAANNKEYLK